MNCTFTSPCCLAGLKCSSWTWSSTCLARLIPPSGRRWTSCRPSRTLPSGRNLTTTWNTSSPTSAPQDCAYSTSSSCTTPTNELRRTNASSPAISASSRSVRMTDIYESTRVYNYLDSFGEHSLRAETDAQFPTASEHEVKQEGDQSTAATSPAIRQPVQWWPLRLGMIHLLAILLKFLKWTLRFCSQLQLPKRNRVEWTTLKRAEKFHGWSPFLSVLNMCGTTFYFLLNYTKKNKNNVMMTQRYSRSGLVFLAKRICFLGNQRCFVVAVTFWRYSLCNWGLVTWKTSCTSSDWALKTLFTSLVSDGAGKGRLHSYGNLGKSFLFSKSCLLWDGKRKTHVGAGCQQTMVEPFSAKTILSSSFSFLRMWELRTADCNPDEMAVKFRPWMRPEKVTLKTAAMFTECQVC